VSALDRCPINLVCPDPFLFTPPGLIRSHQEPPLGLEDLRLRLEHVDAERAQAFARRYITGQSSLQEQAGTDLAAAVVRWRQALRSCVLLEAFGGAYAAYPEHWLRALEAVETRLTQAVALLRKVQTLGNTKPQIRGEVAQSGRVGSFVRATHELIRVGRLVLATALDALADLVAAEQGRLEYLESDFLSLAKELDLPSAEKSVPSVEAIRKAVASLPAPSEVDAKIVCNLTLIPIALHNKLGTTVTTLSGAFYFSPCCNLWLNCVSVETPQPESSDSLAF
jgi:hypothetical protein